MNSRLDRSAYRGKNILIVGVARSGVSAAKLACRAGARVFLFDRKDRTELTDAAEHLSKWNVEWLDEHDQDRLTLENIDILLISPAVPVDSALVQRACKTGITVMGELEFAQTLNPCRTFAVTGTNGKTTTVSLLGEILRTSGKTVHVAGNIGYPLSEAVLECSDEDDMVVEVSSFQLETTKLFSPCAAAVLNVTEDHLNRHGTMEVYTGLKRHIFDAQTENDYAVLNAEDPLTSRMAEGLRPQVMLFSADREVRQGAFVRDGKVVVRLHGESITVCDAEELHIPGKHNLENALAAACMAVAGGVPAESIRRAFISFKGVEHRIEYVRTVNDVRYINDSKGTNCDSTIKAIEAMKTGTVLILGGYDKHVSFDGLARVIVDHPMIHDCVLLGEAREKIEAALLRQEYDGKIRLLEEQIRSIQSSGEQFLSRVRQMQEEHDRRSEAARELSDEKKALEEALIAAQKDREEKEEALRRIQEEIGMRTQEAEKPQG